MPTVLAAAGDPGGAAALLPVLRVLASDTSVRLSLVATGPACAQFAGAGLAATVSEGPWPVQLDLARALVAKQAPDAVLTATSLEPGIELALLRTARACGIPCMAVLDSWTNYRARLLAPDEHELAAATLPDVITVTDDFAAEELRAVGVPSALLRVVGQPAFDETVGWARSAAARTRRDEVRAALGVRAGESLVTFFSQPIAEMYGPPTAPAYRGYDEADAVDALLRVRMPKDLPIRVAIKPHPKEPPTKFDGSVAKAAVPAQVVTSYGVDELIAASDVVVGMTSVTQVQALLAGRPVLSLQPHLRVEDAQVLGRMGVLEPVTDPEGLPAALQAALHQRPEKMSAALPRTWRDGRATERVVGVARELLARRSVPNRSLPERNR